MKFRNILCFVCSILLLTVSAFSVADKDSTTDENVFMNPEGLVRGLYAAVSFEPDNSPDWDYVRKFFIPDVVFAVRKTRTSMEVLNLEKFVEWWLEDIKKYKMKEKGFEETVEKMKMTVYGNIAHCFVVYKARLKTPANIPGQLGLDSFSLMKKDGRWWIVSIANDVVSPQNPLPKELR